MMKIKVRYFAHLRETLGRDDDVMELSDQSRPSDILNILFPNDSLFKHHLRVAVNEEYTKMDVFLKEGDEVVFIPPIAGG